MFSTDKPRRMLRSGTIHSRTVHPRIVRLTHWVNAAAMIVMIMSGLQIHNAYPIAPFRFPGAVTLGGWLGGALLWHFAAMWVLMANFAVMIVYGISTGRFRRKFWPIRASDVVADFKAALRGRLSHDDLSIYNAVQRLLYVGVLLAIVVAILSGFALWKPVQLKILTATFGGFESARVVHFLAMLAIAGFLIVHVAMAVLVPRSLLAMLRGR